MRSNEMLFGISCYCKQEQFNGIRPDFSGSAQTIYKTFANVNKQCVRVAHKF
jgi:hypothetical protein